MKLLSSALVATALMSVPALALAQAQATRQAVLPHTNAGQLTLYEQTNYNGDTWMIDTPSPTVHTDWNIRSITVHPGDSWQICARPRFHDPCIILNQSVNDASLIGIEGQIGSARPAPPPAAHPTPAGH